MRGQAVLERLKRWFRGSSAPQPRVSGSYVPVFAEPQLSADERAAVDRFSDLYYSKLDQGRGLHTIVLSWLGHEMLKCPMDLWIYQELIHRERPDLIVEIGTYKGGSALFLASLCDLVDRGEIIERGSHSELMEKQGFYYRLYSGQFAMVENDE